MIKVKKELDIYEWHRWFAWHPVTVHVTHKDGHYYRTRVWWQPLERRYCLGWGGDWIEYRLIENDKQTKDSKGN